MNLEVTLPRKTTDYQLISQSADYTPIHITRHPDVKKVPAVIHLEMANMSHDIWMRILSPRTAWHLNPI